MIKILKINWGDVFIRVIEVKHFIARYSTLIFMKKKKQWWQMDGDWKGWGFTPPDKYEGASFLLFFNQVSFSSIWAT